MVRFDPKRPLALQFLSDRFRAGSRVSDLECALEPSTRMASSKEQVTQPNNPAPADVGFTLIASFLAFCDSVLELLIFDFPIQLFLLHFHVEGGDVEAHCFISGYPYVNL